MRIERIYNRVIFDELLRQPDLQVPFSFQDDLDVDVGRPSQLVLPHQQTLAAVPETDYTSPPISRMNFRLTNRLMTTF